jgi:ketosteroid isomerase-like protein
MTYAGGVVPGENAQIVQGMLEAFSRSGPEALLEFVHPEFRGEVPPEVSAEPDVYEGHEGVRRYFESFVEVIDDLRFEPYDLVEAGDTVMAVARISGRGKGSGIPVEMQSYSVAEIRDGKIVAMRAHPSREAALEAIGLSA